MNEADIMAMASREGFRRTDAWKSDILVKDHGRIRLVISNSDDPDVFPGAVADGSNTCVLSVYWTGLDGELEGDQGLGEHIWELPDIGISLALETAELVVHVNDHAIERLSKALMAEMHTRRSADKWYMNRPR